MYSWSGAQFLRVYWTKWFEVPFNEKLTRIFAALIIIRTSRLHTKDAMLFGLTLASHLPNGQKDPSSFSCYGREFRDCTCEGGKWERGRVLLSDILTEVFQNCLSISPRECLYTTSNKARFVILPILGGRSTLTLTKSLRRVTNLGYSWKFIARKIKRKIINC
jgi:hypothetical protein